MRATAMPSSASRLRWASSCARVPCIAASAVSARPISSWRPLGAITRDTSCGRSPNAMMFLVSRRTGRSTMYQSAAHSTQVTTAAIVRAILRNVRETRHSASLSGVSSRVTAMPASSGAAPPETWIMVPGLANSVLNAARTLSTNVFAVEIDRLDRGEGIVAPAARPERAPSGRRRDRDGFHSHARENPAREVLRDFVRLRRRRRPRRRSEPPRAYCEAMSRERRLDA